MISEKSKADTVYINNSSRGSFRFHQPNSDGSGCSAGCVNFYSYSAFHYMNNSLLEIWNTIALNQKNIYNVVTY
ncbi:hypothetical protein [Zymobacter sp. IVIA_12111.31 C1]|uniref:hypothetical protein n=1 Tax=Zymobacter sp. IVIA_12111.31 C1 TaxID=3394854 RepID=UPI0039C1066A